MIIAIMIGRAGSKGFPGKNTKKILGRGICEYPLIAAKKSKFIEEIFISTDCPKITRIGKKYTKKFIKRPKHLNDHKALGDTVFEFAYEQIKKKYKEKNIKIRYFVLLFANAPLVTSNMIDEGIKYLDKNKSFDSAVSTSVYNMWSPLRARKLTKNGSLKPFVKFEYFGNPKTLNCDRDSQGNVYYADMSVSVVRPKCLENLKNGLLPQKWMGKKIAPIKSYAGFDIDYNWQTPLLEHRLKLNGFKFKKNK
jgi:CMP-N-acetylneuraminic acid synthetase